MCIGEKNVASDCTDPGRRALLSGKAERKNQEAGGKGGNGSMAKEHRNYLNLPVGDRTNFTRRRTSRKVTFSASRDMLQHSNPNCFHSVRVTA